MKSYIIGLGLALTVSLIPIQQPTTELNNIEPIDIKYQKLVLSVPNERKLARRKTIKPKAENATGVEISVINGDCSTKHGKEYIYCKESRGNPAAINQSSGACGIGQAYPCSKMNCSLSDYNCQDKFFTDYMLNRYGSWTNAEQFHRANKWW